MDSRRLAGARPRLITWIGLLVITLLCMPTLVRATQSLVRDSASIRLNRGFDAPESKCRVIPPAAPAFAAALAVTTVPAPRVVLAAHPVTPSLASSQHETSPAVLRGPPSSLL